MTYNLNNQHRKHKQLSQIQGKFGLLSESQGNQKYKMILSLKAKKKKRLVAIAVNYT